MAKSIKPKYKRGDILKTAVGNTFKIIGIFSLTIQKQKIVYYKLKHHIRHESLPVSYVDFAKHLTCINRTKAGKILYGR